MHTLTRLLRFVSKKLGQKTAIHSVRRIQFPTSLLSNSTAPLSVYVLRDLSAYLKRYGFTSADYFQLGSEAQQDLQTMPLLGPLKKSKSILEVHESIFTEHFSSFDQHCNYRILRADADSLEFSALSTGESSQALLESPKSSHLGCIQKAGVAAALGTLISHPLSEVRHPRCVYLGDPECLFEVRFAPKNRGKVRPLSPIQRLGLPPAG